MILALVSFAWLINVPSILPKKNLKKKGLMRFSSFEKVFDEDLPTKFASKIRRIDCAVKVINREKLTNDNSKLHLEKQLAWGSALWWQFRNHNWISISMLEKIESDLQFVKKYFSQTPIFIWDFFKKFVRIFWSYLTFNIYFNLFRCLMHLGFSGFLTI